MQAEPTLFASTMLETANEALLFCAECLEKSEHPLAGQLEGLTPVKTPVVGKIAMEVLLDIYPTVRGDMREYVAIAISTLRRALAEKPQLAAVA